MEEKITFSEKSPKADKILLYVFIALILVAVALTYWRIMVKNDYVIEAQVDCDPYSETCFIWECDPESKEEGEACTGDPENDIWYYKIAHRNAANIPSCDPETDEECDPWACELIENECGETLCDEVTGEEQGVECNDPVKYSLENPIEEEDCDPEIDEECEPVEDLSADEAECDPEVDEDCEVEDEADSQEGDEEGEDE